MDLKVLPENFAVCRLLPETKTAWVEGGFSSVTVTPSEVSVVCETRFVPDDVKHEPGWRCLRVQGTFDFDAVGVLAALAVPLAEAGVPILALSTFDTDYLLVKDSRLPDAVSALENAGHTVHDLV